MKKFLGILAINLILCSTSVAATFGSGELKLTPGMVDYFIQYLKGGRSNAPMMFLVTLNGNDGTYWYCPAGQANCRGSSSKRFIEDCERKTKQTCAVFARWRTVKWKNGINQGKKESKFNSKWSDSEIRTKLTSLGFLGGTTTSLETDDKNKELVEQLKTLDELYKSGALSKLEYTKAKEKVLNQ